MTKTAITRGRLQEISEDGFLKHGESKELARMALAAMDGEPVAEVHQVPNVGICAALGPSIRMLCPLEPGTKLYRHAQPAPVVPEEMTPQQASRSYGGEVRGYRAGWNACRAAMLAAAQHDTPALNSLQSVDSVAGKWIPVSERMPEDRTQVILWDAEIGEVTSGHYSHKTHTFYHCGDAIENEITHWMAPPAAPQEVE